MKLQVMSDLHLEFRPGTWREYVETFPVLADVLVLAGDVHVGEAIVETLCAFAKRWRHIVFVAGNHELYNTSPAAVTRHRDEVLDRAVNVHWLENSAATIEGQRFIGCTLWFPEPADARIKRGLTDYHVIRDFEPWVSDRCETSKRFLEHRVRMDDVIVTHHLPHPASIAKKYRGDAMNAFFLCDMSRLIAEAQPRLWIHGHTHESVDATVGGTRIVCNPFGYAHDGENRFFRSDLTIDVSDDCL